MSMNRNYHSLWDQIDRSLVDLKLQEPLNEHIKNIDNERHSIEQNNRDNRHAYITAILNMVERRADEWLDQIRLVYCDVWRQQGHANSPNFLRTLRDNIVEPVVRARTSAEVSDFKRIWDRCGFPGRQVLESQLSTFERSMRNLEHRWKTKLEIEARELEYRPSVTTDKGGSDTLGEKPTTVPSESHGNQAAWTPRDKYVAKLGYRSSLKRAIALIFINNPEASDLEVCRGLDADGAVELPKTWSIERNRRFEIAYKNSVVRRRIEIAISKVRTDLRGRGL